MTIRRRELLLLASTLSISCHANGRSKGILTARPLPSSPSTSAPGTHRLGIRTKRDALLFVPAKPTTNLVLYLHGAGGSEEQGPNRFGGLAEKLPLLLLSPASEGRTWDAIGGDFGPDILMIDAALRKAFETVRVERVIVAGFSDGASYALGLGLRNAGLFRAIAAFSPGFAAGSIETPKSKSRVFVSHGTGDEILPVDSCSRQLVPQLKRDGHTVNYREFPGPHTVPAGIAEEGLRWALQL